MLEYRKTGGIAGVEEILRIEDDGAAWLRRSMSGELQDEISARLDPGKAEEVRSLAERTDFSGLDETEPEAYDQLSYELTHRSAAGERSVRLGALNLPESLQPLVRLLDGIVERLLKKEPT